MYPAEVAFFLAFLFGCLAYFDSDLEADFFDLASDLSSFMLFDLDLVVLPLGFFTYSSSSS